MKHIYDYDNWVSVDTETTGLYAQLGDRPYYVSAWEQTADNQEPPPLQPDPILPNHLQSPLTRLLPGKKHSFWSRVNPHNRSVYWTREQRLPIKKLLANKPIFMFNSCFDLSMLASVGIYFTFTEPQLSTLPPKGHRIAGYVHIKCPVLLDVQVLRHVIDNRGPDSLKAASEYYLDIPNPDEKELKSLTVSSRREAKKSHWKLSPAVPADYWMVHQAQLAGNPGYPAPHPEYGTQLDFYGLIDAYRTLALGLVFLWDAEEGIIPDVEVEEDYDPLVPVQSRMRTLSAVYKMTRCGLALHTQEAEKALLDLNKATTHLSQKVNKQLKKSGQTHPNPDSKDQVIHYLHEYRKLPVLAKTDSGVPSTAKTVLKKHLSSLDKEVFSGSSATRQFIRNLLDLRELSKLYQYLEKYIEKSQNKTILTEDQLFNPTRPELTNTCRLLGNYRTTGTALTRLASCNPNLQNIKSGSADAAKDLVLRNLFGPPPGRVWISIDYSQLELRIFARLANDQAMLDGFKNGIDFHSNTAAAIHDRQPEDYQDLPDNDPLSKERKKAKFANFAMIYGGGPKKLIALTGKEDAYEKFSLAFPQAHNYLLVSKQEAERKGYVYTRQNYLLRVYPEPAYKVVNMEDQGTAGGLVEDAMVALTHGSDALIDNTTCWMIANVHDELIFEIDTNLRPDWPQLAQNIAKVMQDQGNNIDTITPVDISVHTKSWGQSQPIEDFL